MSGFLRNIARAQPRSSDGACILARLMGRYGHGIYRLPAGILANIKTISPAVRL